MSNLNIDQKTIGSYLSDKRANFLIPDYQRPYAWGEEECRTLWSDILAFAYPDNNPDNFDLDSEYFLGPIVTFQNDDKQLEVIDGQQRITTLMLLLRAFYERFEKMKDDDSKKTKEKIQEGLWKTDEFGNPDKNITKITSEVITDDKRDEFSRILKEGKAQDTDASIYADNYRLFQKLIGELINDYPDYFARLPMRLLNNCVLLPIEADSRDSALRIFSTLNDRGKPLADSDIFKAQLYKFYSKKGKTDEFIERWKNLDEVCDEIFKAPSGSTALDEIFTRYMHYERAKQGIKNSSVEALRSFYERGSYALFQKEETFDNLVDLADFWKDVYGYNPNRFDGDVLKRFFILSYAPNNMWTNITSVYYLHNRDENGQLETKSFIDFLDKIIGFIWGYALEKPGVNSLRTPVFAEMVSIVNDQKADFQNYKFDPERLRKSFKNFRFTNNKALTKSMLAWWMLQDPDQELLPYGTLFQIEHIYSVKRAEHENSSLSKDQIESLGNKVMLERDINIRASDYRFEDKKRYYLGTVGGRSRRKTPTQVHEIMTLIEKDDFTGEDIIEREEKIIDQFISYLDRNNLLIKD